MKKKIQGYESVLLALVEVIVGVILLLRPVGFTTAVIMCVGAFLAVQGLLSIVAYFRRDVQKLEENHLLVKGLTFLAGGVFCLVRSDWFLAAFPVLTALYGVLILLTGFYKLQWASDMFRLKMKYWYVALISAAFSLILAVLILANPFTSADALWVITGLTMIVGAILDVAAFIFRKK